MKKYKRTLGAVDVDAAGLTNIQTGDVIEVEPDVAVGLDGQDGWEHVPDPLRVRAGKKAAETRENDDNEGGES
jgi:hypothetical protein